MKLFPLVWFLKSMINYNEPQSYNFYFCLWRKIIQKTNTYHKYDDEYKADPHYNQEWN